MQANGEKIDRLRTRREVAERLRVSVRTIIRYERQGRLRPLRHISPRLVFFRDSDIEQLVGEGV